MECAFSSIVSCRLPVGPTRILERQDRSSEPRKKLVRASQPTPLSSAVAASATKHHPPSPSSSPSLSLAGHSTQPCSLDLRLARCLRQCDHCAGLPPSELSPPMPPAVTRKRAMSQLYVWKYCL